ncbi:peroxisomal membrane protein 13-like protein [Tanacetum coccineum]
MIFNQYESIKHAGWKFLITFADVLGVWPFTLDKFVEASIIIIYVRDLGSGPPPKPKPWEQAGTSSRQAPFKPSSPGSTSDVVEASGTARPGEMVPVNGTSAVNTNALGRPTPSRPWMQRNTYGASKHYHLHYRIRNEVCLDWTLRKVCLEDNKLLKEQYVPGSGSVVCDKLKEAIELLDHGEVADAKNFGLLFRLCGKLKKLEESKKVHDYFLRSGFRVDVGLVHKGKNKVDEFRNPTLYKDEEKIKVLLEKLTASPWKNLMFMLDYGLSMEGEYIQPHEHTKLSQVELLVVDEATAIPLSVVKSLLGPYLVFLSSTAIGYWVMSMIPLPLCFLDNWKDRRFLAQTFSSLHLWLTYSSVLVHFVAEFLL